MVNWQRNDLYINEKQYDKLTGTSRAIRNEVSGVQSHSFGGYIIMGLSQNLPQILSNAENFFAASSSSKVSNTEKVTSEDLNTAIGDVLGKYKDQNITSIEDLEAYKLSIPSVIANNNQINKLEGELSQLQANIETTLSEDGYDKETMSKMQDRKNQIEQIIQTTKEENLTLQKTLDTVTEDITTLSKYKRMLRRIDGSDSIDGLVNKDTGNINELVKKLKKAQVSGNQTQIKKIESELQKALQEYVKNPNNSNKTIITLAEKYGINREKK